MCVCIYTHIHTQNLCTFHESKMSIYIYIYIYIYTPHSKRHILFCLADVKTTDRCPTQSQTSNEGQVVYCVQFPLRFSPAILVYVKTASVDVVRTVFENCRKGRGGKAVLWRHTLQGTNWPVVNYDVPGRIWLHFVEGMKLSDKYRV